MRGVPRRGVLQGAPVPAFWGADGALRLGTAAAHRWVPEGGGAFMPRHADGARSRSQPQGGIRRNFLPCLPRNKGAFAQPVGQGLQ